MAPSRSDTWSGSFSAHLLFILTVPILFSFISTRDAPAYGPRKQSSRLTRLHIDFEGKGRIQGFPIRGPLEKGFSFSSRLGPDNSLTQPFASGGPFNKTKPFSFGDAAADEIGGKTAQSQAKESKPVSFLNDDYKATVIIRRRSWGTSPRLPDPVVPLKSTLATGVMYRSGNGDRAGGFTMDLVLPARLGGSSLLFLESRAGYRNRFSGLPKWADHRFDLDLGMGWRTVWDDKVMLGANAFWDAARLNGAWYSSPGFGVEFGWAMTPGVWDVALNMYRGGGIDLQSGFTLPVLEDHLDMRFYVGKYRFFDGEFILGSRGGVEVSSAGRLLAVSYEYGQDTRNPQYHAVNCSLTVPFSLGRLFSGKNPIELPALPRDREEHYARRLQSDTVKRIWSSPDTVARARHTPQGKRWTSPGILTDTIFKPTKADAAKPTALKDDSDRCRQRKCCCKGEREEKNDVLNGLYSAILLTGATILGADYTYRSAFGPFELEPYEVKRIKKEMPHIHRRK